MKNWKSEQLNVISNVYLGRMKEIKISGEDIECDHKEADELLCDLLEVLGFTDIVKVFRDLPRWYA